MEITEKLISRILLDWQKQGFVKVALSIEKNAPIYYLADEEDNIDWTKHNKIQ
jgi:hypothetical protein